MRDVSVVRIARSSLVAVAVLILLIIGAGQSDAVVPNPGWPAQCPQRLVVVLDLSASIGPNLGAVKKSASDLVDALRGAPNQVGVVAFGTEATVAIPMLDVGNDEQRRRLKDEVNDVRLLPGDGGGTNWEAALTTAASLKPDIVLFLTDGQPTAHGDPFSAAGVVADADNLTAAVRVADSMRSGGTRIVGVGMGLLPEYVPNLVQVTGPVAGDDYYQTGASADGLLNKLYDIASKACGIPVAALPQPEGGAFPVLPVIGGVLAAAVLAVIGGYWLSGRGPERQPGSVKEKAKPLKDPSISWADVPSVAPDVTAAPSEVPIIDVASSPEGPSRRALGGPRRISVPRLHAPIHDERVGPDSTHNDGSSDSAGGPR